MPNAAQGDNPDQVIRFFHLLPIQLTIAYVKGTISGYFCARFMPNPVKRDSLCNFPKTIVLVFRELGIFWRQGPLMKK